MIALLSGKETAGRVAAKTGAGENKFTAFERQIEGR